MTGQECGIFQLPDRLITNNARCTREIKSRIFMIKAAFKNKKKRILFPRKVK